MSDLLKRVIRKILRRPERKIQFLTRLRDHEVRMAKLAGRSAQRCLAEGNRTAAKDWSRLAVGHFRAAEVYQLWLRQAA